MIPSAHRSLFTRADVLSAAAPALSLRCVAVCLLPGVVSLPELRWVVLDDGVRVGLLGTEQAQRQAWQWGCSARVVEHVGRDAGPGRSWLVVVGADRLATVAPLAPPAPVALA